MRFRWIAFISILPFLFGSAPFTFAATQAECTALGEIWIASSSSCSCPPGKVERPPPGVGCGPDSATAPAPAVAPANPGPGTSLKNPLGEDQTNLNQIIGRIIGAVAGFSGAIALGMFVWGGLQMMISQGDVDKIKKGKSTLTWAGIGLVVIFTSYALVSAVINALSRGSI